jgi:hypothetical protein
MILQGVMSPTHGRKSDMGDLEVFLIQLFSCPSCYVFNVSFIVFCSLSFVNLGMRFLLRGRVVTPRVMISLITFIKTLIKDQIH